jgi:anhydro-N-acetylmuramic acid kinase
MDTAKKESHVIGVMSGSSLDGLDIALCKLETQNGNWQHVILAAECLPFSADWRNKLHGATNLSGKELWQLHAEFGKYIGESVHRFVAHNNFQQNIDCIASHGHTVFHFPEERFTTQIGDGAAIAAASGITTVCDLRALDVAHGGTGAPIVPVADKLLFSDYDFCLNLGGIANISSKKDGKILAFDVCPCNQLLDFFAQQLNKDFDENGVLASTGNTDEEKLKQLLANSFHQLSFPKSLDNSFSKINALPILESIEGSIQDKLRTAVEYIAVQLAKDFATVAAQLNIDLNNSKVLVTGGGAFNQFLIDRLKDSTNIQIVIPDDATVKFKEALAMALIGVLRLRGEVNVFSSVTNAKNDTVNGAIYLP